MTRLEALEINVGDRLVVTNGSCKGISIIVTAVSKTKKNIWFVSQPYGQMWSHRFCRKFTEKDAAEYIERV